MNVLQDYFDPVVIDQAHMDAFGEVFPYADFHVPAADDLCGWMSLSGRLSVLGMPEWKVSILLRLVRSIMSRQDSEKGSCGCIATWF